MRSRDQRARKVDAKTLTSRWSYSAEDLGLVLGFGYGINTQGASTDSLVSERSRDVTFFTRFAEYWSRDHPKAVSRL